MRTTIIRVSHHCRAQRMATKHKLSLIDCIVITNHTSIAVFKKRLENVKGCIDIIGGEEAVKKTVNVTSFHELVDLLM